MEVIGAASALITVIQIAATVVSICYDYQSNIRQYPKDVVKITRELQSLRNVLERLADIANSPEDSTSMALPAIDSLNHSGGPLEICKVELKQLELKLAPAKGRLFQFGRALMWPLKEKDVQKTIGTLARQRGIFQLALTADQTTMTLAIKTVTSRNNERLISLTHSFHAAILEKTKDRIFKWLAAPDPSLNHHRACRMKQQETGRWLIESMKYIKWRNQQASFLWLHGIPGCGKTVLCSTVIEDIASTCQIGSRSALAYYYFVFNEIDKQTYDGLVRSLVAQLFSQSPEKSKTMTMEALFTDCSEGQKTSTLKSLVQALRVICEDFEKIYLVFDALDECVEIPAVILLIQEILGWHNQNLHILVTSRKEVLIEREFRPLITDQVHVQRALVDADIKLLVRECLRSDPELSRWSETIKAEIEKTLHEGSKGMFRWAVCQLDTLRRCIKPSAIRKALNSLPKTLDETYERILCDIDQDHADDALKVLRWLAFSARPLELQEVAEATAVTLEPSPRFDPENRLRHPTDLLAICSSLICVSAKPIGYPVGLASRESSFLKSPHPDLISIHESTYITDIQAERKPLDAYCHPSPPLMTKEHSRHHEVCLAHDSVKEYLMSERIKRSKAAFYSIGETSTNVYLASSCLTYLMHFKDPLSDSIIGDLSEYPLLRYSAQEWESHLANSRDLSHDTLINSLLQEFFLAKDSSFNNWLVMPFSPYHSNFRQMEDNSCEGEDLNLEGRLYHASRLGLLDICKNFLEQGVSADPPIKSNTGLVKSLSTPLQIAAYKGHEAVVRLLLDHGADVNQRSTHASTLDYAVAEGRESVVCLLLERGAEVTIQTTFPYYGLTGLASLVLAAGAGSVGIVKLLLDSGSYPRLREPCSEAYHEAMAQGHQAVADVLLEYGTDPKYLAGVGDSDGSDVEYFDAVI